MKDPADNLSALTSGERIGRHGRRHGGLHDRHASRQAGESLQPLCVGGFGKSYEAIADHPRPALANAVHRL